MSGWNDKLKRATVITATGVLLYFLLPWSLNAAARRLIRADQWQSADLIIALGGDPFCLRELKAAELYRLGAARKVSITGSPLSSAGGEASTGPLKLAFLRNRGVAESDIVIIDDVFNTRTEADKIIALMRARGWRSAVVVTSPFHSRRALYTFERAAPDLRFHSAPTPAAAPEWRPDQWWRRRGDMALTVREFLAWANTAVNGWR